jgi:hypothetical protein
MRVRTKPKKTAEVAIISMNPETLDGLHSYLSAAGVHARCMTDLDECVKLAVASTQAFILFPDDYAWERVVAGVADLTERRPAALPLLVTAHPKRFAKLIDVEKVLVVPRPVWGWTILDAIRAHLDGGPPSAPRDEAHRGP